MEDYKVYMHEFPNGKKYVGITMQKPQKRWSKGRGYVQNKYMTNAIIKYGWDNIKHIILFTNLTKEQAEKIEIELIKKYKTNIMQYGYNIEDGGCHNGKTSIETRRKQSEIAKGKHRSPATEFKKGNNLGVPCSEELKEKLSRERKGKHVSPRTEFKKGHATLNNKKVICIETNIIYFSIKEAGQKNNINSGHICSVCNGKRKSAGKLHWKYI